MKQPGTGRALQSSIIMRGRMRSWPLKQRPFGFPQCKIVTNNLQIHRMMQKIWAGGVPPKTKTLAWETFLKL